MTNTAINTAENSTEVSPAVQTQTEDTNVDPAQPEATTKKRSTSAKLKASEDATKTDAPEEVKAAIDLDETAASANNPEQGPAEAEIKVNSEAPEDKDIKNQSDDLKTTHPPEAFLNRFNSKRKLEVKNNGPHSFEVYTKTPLPAGETVVLELANNNLFRMVVSKFTQLNNMAGKQRYTFKEV
ncbi:hypothetical protein [Acinetobacter pittii]|uniref:hypothetical protein n=1 Tax=Acinetobacter pittii TaxID=48296 RepID=UPI002AFE6C87|nr:hypothetical protein [Acinetobacter pittii]